MGIERFFAAINKNYDVVSVMSNTKKLKTDVFFLDFNSIIHVVSAKYISELNIKNSLNNNEKYDENNIILQVKKYLDNLLENVECKLVYIALDGVPTFSKILEQKKRRFVANLIDELVKDKTVHFHFNKGSISPGTKFTKKISEFLHNENFKTKTIISDAGINGEGEFKIIDYIYKNKIKDYVIYSPDADLIILTMITWTVDTDSKIKILRHDQQTGILNVIYINSLINYMISYYKERVKNKIDHDKYIKDLCFIFTVFGNDFVPRIDEINISMDLYLLLDAYIINYVDNGYILNKDNRIIPKTFYNLIKFLNKYSKILEKRTSLQYKFHNFNYATMINLYLDIKNKKPNEFLRFYLDFIDNFDFNNKYGKLQYYLLNDKELLKLSSFTYKNNFNQAYIENKPNQYLKMIPIEYSSKSKKHLIAMKDLSPRDKELYLINYKLDNYYDLFMTENTDFTCNKKEMVNEYFKGLSWITNYYFNSCKLSCNKVDETWFYKFYSAPSITDIYNYFNHSLLNYQFNNVPLNITPIEQLLYITPIKQDNIDTFIEMLDTNYFNSSISAKTIKKFIETHKGLFYNLDEIYASIKSKSLKKSILNCTSAFYISKCHYYILDQIQPIKQFKLV